MSFLGNLFNDPKGDPRKPEEVADPNVVVSPDTRRANRLPPGQSRTRKWPVLDAHGTPEHYLASKAQLFVTLAKGSTSSSPNVA